MPTFKLHTLTVRNYVVFVEEATVNFASSNVNQIEGIFKNDPNQSNGAGKSILLCAISLALFGKGIRFNHMADYIAPTQPAGGIYISLSLKDEEGNILTISRWRKAGSSSNKASVELNGVLIIKDATNTKIDELIVDYIGVSYTNFLSCIFSVMLPGFLLLRPAQRFEILENALAIKKLDSVVKKITTQAKTVDDQLAATTLVLNTKLQALAQETAKKEIFSQNRLNLVQAIESQTEELNQLTVVMTSLHDKRSNLMDMLKQAEEKSKAAFQLLSSAKVEVSAVATNSSKLVAEFKNIQSCLETIDDSHAVCKMCKSTLDRLAKDNLTKHYTKELAMFSEQLEEATAKSSNLQNSYNEAQKLVDTIKGMLSKIEQEITIKQYSIGACQKTISITKTNLENSDMTFDEGFLDALSVEVELMNSQKTSLTKELSIVLAWKQAMSKNGLRLAYKIRGRHFECNCYLIFASLAYKVPTHVKFYIEDAGSTPHLDFTVNGKSAGAFSTGERRLLEIALTLSLLALLKTAGMTLQTLILDEAMDGLSTSSKEAVVSIISILASEYQIIMISHDTMLKQLPGNIIRVIKDTTTATSVLEQYTRC